MIKATNFSLENDKDGIGKTVRASLVADTSAEVTAQGTSGDGIIGLSKDDTLSFGSTCLCKNGDFGMLGSDGQWTF